MRGDAGCRRRRRRGAKSAGVWTSRTGRQDRSTRGALLFSAGVPRLALSYNPALALAKSGALFADSDSRPRVFHAALLSRSQPETALCLWNLWKRSGPFESVSEHVLPFGFHPEFPSTFASSCVYCLRVNRFDSFVEVRVGWFLRPLQKDWSISCPNFM